MFFSDRLTLDRARRSADGYMGIHARAARSGIYQYLGREVDPEGTTFAADQIVNVYRPPEEVFDKASLGSFIGKPITDDHPTEAVTADNWRDLAGGTVMGAAKDGEFVGFDLAFMDAALIAAVDAGKKELSNGYDCKLDFVDGVTADGTAYQAVQRNIRGNHVAVVKAGRAGSECRIGDAAICAPIPSDAVRELLVDQRTYEAERDRVINADSEPGSGAKPVPKLILIDGLQIDISNVDVAEATITSLQGKLQTALDAKAKAENDLATAVTDKATADAKIVTLESQITDLAITPAKLRDAAAAYALVADKAKAMGVTFADDADEGAIRKAVVQAKIGDAAKDWNDAQIAASFDTLTADVKPAKGTDPVAASIGGGIRPLGDSGASIQDARRASLNRKESAYLGGTAPAGNA